MLRTPLLHHPSRKGPSLFTCRETPTTGVAAFATTDIAQNTVILTEAPLITVGANDDYDMDVYTKWTALDDATKTKFAELVTTRNRVAAMKTSIEEQAKAKEQRAQKMVAAGRHAVYECAAVVATVYNNDWEVPAEFLPWTKGDWRALFLAAARFNHSCWPNLMTVYAVDKEKAGVTLSLVTVRPIRKGEELLVCYLDNEMGFEARQDKLQHYGFACACPCCELDRYAATAASKLQRDKAMVALKVLSEWNSAAMVWTDAKKQVRASLTHGRTKKGVLRCHERGIDALKRRKEMNRHAGRRTAKRDEQNLEALKQSLVHVMGLPWPAK